MLGVNAARHGPFFQLWYDGFRFEQIDPIVLGISGSVLAVILVSRFVSRKLPGALIAVVGAIVLSWALDLSSRGVPVLGAFPGGLPTIGMPRIDWNWPLFQHLLPSAFAMFVVILAQSAATSRAYAARCNERFSENRVDFSAAETLCTLGGLLQEQKIRLVLAVVADEVRSELDRSGLTALIGEDAYYARLGDVLNVYWDRNGQTSHS